MAQIARTSRRTIYRVKHALLEDFLKNELRNPTLKIALA
jgi:hypothetical protein